MNTKPLSRLALPVLLASLALTSCGGGKPSLTFMSGGGPYQDAQDKAFIRPFEKDTGITVHDDTTLSYAKVQTMVRAGHVTIDVIPAEGYWAVQQCGKLLQPIDTKLVNLAPIDPAFKQSPCAAPLLTYTSSVYYKIGAYSSGATPNGCRDFFDVQRFPGKRAVSSVAVPNPVLECALIADGVPRDELYPLDIERAFRKIETIRKDLIFWNTGSDSAQLMTSGEATMVLAWNGRAYTAIAEQKAGFAQTYGESITHYDALVVPKGVRDTAAAMKLVDYMMDAPRQAYLTTLIPYAPTNRDAKLTGLNPTLRDFLPDTNPKLAQGVVVQDQRWWAANADAVTKRWQQSFQK